MSTTPNPKKRLLYDDDQLDPQNVQVESKDEIFTSTAIHDRHSTFIAHFHPASSAFTTTTTKPQALAATIKHLQSHPSFRDASHRVAAWRKRSAQQTLITSSTSHTTSVTVSASKPKAVHVIGSDDDGEKYAGKRLENVLVELDVEGVLVVARWYGGVLLGPVRFSHIESCAREAIRVWKGSSAARGEVKKVKLDDGVSTAMSGGVGDEVQRVKLAKQLVERDVSISVLRDLLVEKTKATTSTAEKDGKQDSSQQSASMIASPKMKVGYSEMPLAKLKQLEKARDATIAFILKQLDKVEEDENKKALEAFMAEVEADDENEGG